MNKASSDGTQWGQRVWKRQPLGGAERSGGEPGMPVIRSIGPVSGGNEVSRPCVYGMLRVREERASRRGLDDLPRVHDPDPVRELDQQREVVRDEQHGEVEVALERLELLQDLALDDDVECRRRLVEDQELGVSASAIAMITRWRMPPESSCGYARMRDGSMPTISSSTPARASDSFFGCARALASCRRTGRRCASPG